MNQQSIMKAEKATRIFVGGLGESVTEENLKTMFESVGSGGSVETIDIIRTKGRSFAYVNFCPYSDNFFPKLFSIYNGCVWKGGRLKLENAKEHYLSRLKRELEEDAQLVNCGVDAAQTKNTSMTLDEVHSSLDKRQLQIFFPRLRKLKSLPLSGTGKHKYSFPRVELSTSLSIHFCDCEEHSIPAFTGHSNGENKFDSKTRGEMATINDEINLMKSVMNKIFEGEISLARSGGTEPTNIEDSLKPNNNLQIWETEVMSESDEDNFILNVVTSRSRESTAPSNKEEEIISNIQDVSKKQKLNTGREMKKSKPVVRDRTNKKKEVSPIEKEMVTLSDNFSGDASVFSMKPSDKKAAEWKLDDVKTGRGSAWLQKCSWTQLVGERNSSSFSITQIVPGLMPEKQISVPKVGDFTGVTIDHAMKQVEVDCEDKISSQQPAGEAPAAPMLDRAGAAKHVDKAPATPSLERVGAAKTSSGRDFVIGETCTFMRSAASLKDWAKTKAALNASLKRKKRDH